MKTARHIFRSSLMKRKLSANYTEGDVEKRRMRFALVVVKTETNDTWIHLYSIHDIKHRPNEIKYTTRPMFYKYAAPLRSGGYCPCSPVVVHN